MAEQWQFLFAVFLMYGFIFTIYSLSDGAIYGLPSANLLMSSPTSPSENPIIYFLETSAYIVTLVFSFASVILIGVGLFDFWWLTPINWAIIGTTVYIYIRTFRGGG